MKNKPSLSNRYVLVGDLLLAVISVLGSYALRLELGSQFFDYLPSALWMIGLALVIKPVVYYLFGLYQRIWIYASVEELKLIVAAVTAASVLLAGGMVVALSLGAFVGMPRSVLVIDWLLSMILVGGLRFSFRLMAESRGPVASLVTQPRRVLIVGAGDAGALVVREMQKNPQLNLQPIGFLDDNPAKQKQQIHGVPVVGTLSELPQVLERYKVDEVVIAIPSAPGRVVRVVADIARLKGVPFRTMPGIYELLGGKVSVSRLREVDISDLLRREPLQVNEGVVGEALSGRVVLVTGAGGSIGRELCRQIARWGPKLLILLGHGENSIFETLLELRESFPALNLQPIIADVRDRPRLEVVFNEYRPEVVFHTAAHKHVPLMEINVEEAITNNVLGTLILVEVSLAYLVDRFVFISTDKAIRPVNVYGATKRLAEMIVLNAAQRSAGRFSVVRFGNVLGSRGSVVPIFKRQIAQGGPITITHPDMKRYFMTIPEAAHLVLQVAGMGRGGETYLLNMGQQIRILDLAEDLIRLSGLEPGRDIEIVFTGIRPGEKLSEDLWDEGVSLRVTDHPDIFRVEHQEVLEGEALYRVVTELIKLARAGEREQIVALLDEVIPGSAIRSTPPPELTSVV
ncbi:nucleoside-diphosphate sugar epimerase/dehydratase [Thermanaerothrix sp.]|uniref:polysaccharide biosynthesis protein n=1 Tax=Thermanaerothrix sp. TaxID=2972675 RepID=UPI002ADE13F4|nr:nucleoside-diphosphate sugar epimerase/dehydratase [Thermanaerothrix sp.]